MRTMSRYEFKYGLNQRQYRSLFAALQSRMVLDSFSRQRGYYWVRSLYFDTADYVAYWEKVHGDSHRCKLRFRSYGLEPAAAPYVSLELKTKIGDRTDKFSSFVDTPPAGNLRHYFRALQSSTDPVVKEFLRRVYVQHLQPKVLVQYRRQGFVTRDPSPLRVTLDHQVESAAAATLFPPRTRFRGHGPAVVLEVKTDIDPPHWLQGLVVQCGLPVQKNSKYAQAVENAAWDVIRPPS